jgi:hypothetical protein
MPVTLKDRFLDAIVAGELGEDDGFGIIIRLQAFKRHFDDIHSDYVNSFLPAATIEPGREAATHTKYLFRIRPGVYRVHPSAIAEYKRLKKYREASKRPVVQLQATP